MHDSTPVCPTRGETRALSSIGRSINCYDERFNKITLPKRHRPSTSLNINKALSIDKYASSKEPSRDCFEIN